MVLKSTLIFQASLSLRLFALSTGSTFRTAYTLSGGLRHVLNSKLQLNGKCSCEVTEAGHRNRLET
jgi:hypothetical protein